MGTYSYHKATFKNYCPNCHRYGTLHYEVGPASWTSPEGMWYCSCCDMDFCAQCGKSHDGRGVWLVRTTIPKPLPKVVVNNTNQTNVTNATANTTAVNNSTPHGITHPFLSQMTHEQLDALGVLVKKSWMGERFIY